jgi:drug/metabolite transporter (DMT)-like permease
MFAATSAASPVRGIFLMISAVTVFTVMSAFIKAVPGVPAGEAMFFRSVLAMPIILVWLAWQGDWPHGIRTNSIRNHAVRGLVGSAAMGLGFAGLKYLPLPEVTAIRFATPVVMVVLAALMLGERLRLIRITAVALGLVGVVIIIWPRLSFGLNNTEALGALMVFWFSLTSTGASLLTLPFGWVWPDPGEAAYLVGAGLVGGMGQILLTSSYRLADAGVLAPFTYVSMLWSVVIGYVWFDEVPTRPMLFGAALVILAGVVIVLRERQLGNETTARRKVRAKGLQ